MSILSLANRENHEQNKFKESTSTSGQVGVVVINPDGTSIASSQPSAPSILVAFRTTVTLAGVRVQLGSNSISGGIIQAPSTNTGLIYVGGSTVSSSSYGAELQPGQSAGIAIDNTNK